ncbi:hypothetical protein [Schaalia hyovaginalis]|uniref:Uncharacterized protein n=1 Tax=Schaalia hyovaginalis TaxID=29316 RepID=A0A923IXV1_9ACTO|nr:hypothetical protein [Schaalia hyovaginalis]MBB6335422.1 hypothetical protein [Schaalia hyovaginalis]MDY2669340.1 hypothetical protein [Schaalia hyovaginalis]MDY6213622.1 hypothetical protein [Schaalia hyovaginalis]
MRLLTETEQNILIEAITSHREHLEDLIFRDQQTSADAKWQEELTATNNLYELVFSAGSVCLFDQK